ncbi:MAG: DUF1553 domain-containing protein [Planctomycetota bacterium]
MTIQSWMKDTLLVSVILFSGAMIAAYLFAADRVKTPSSFDPTLNLSDAWMASVNNLDRQIENSLENQNLVWSEPAAEKTVFRRLALALTGSLPSFEEFKELEKIPGEQRVHWYVSHLLDDKRSADHLAERLARVFVGVEEGPFLVYRRRRFVSWLSDQIQNNRPYDEITYNILTSTGLWTDSPEVNYYTYNIIPDDDAENQPDPIRLAARTSRAFLGMRIDCLQCHDDFLGTMNLETDNEITAGTQKHFHELAAFFSQVQNSLVGINDNKDSDIYSYQLLDSSGKKPIPASVPFKQELDDSTESNLRLRLAKWVTHSENQVFSAAIINRVWAIMFGRPFIEPVDDLSIENQYPEAFEFLIDDFAIHGYNLHRLIRQIAASRAFGRSSSAEFEILDSHLKQFAVFPMSRLRPEQMAGAIIQATSLKTLDSTSHIISRLTKFGQQNDFVDRFGDLGEDEFNERPETITQRLLMMNGEMVGERLDNGINSTARIANLAPSNEKAVETVYLAVLSRKPTAKESRHFANQLNDLTRSQRNTRIKDIYWTLINSAEFSWNH